MISPISFFREHVEELVVTTISLDSRTVDPTALREIFEFHDEVLLSWEFEEGENQLENPDLKILMLAEGTLKAITPKSVEPRLTFRQKVGDVNPVKIGVRGKPAFQFQASYGSSQGQRRFVYHVALPEYCCVIDEPEFVYSNGALNTDIVTREKRQSITWISNPGHLTYAAVFLGPDKDRFDIMKAKTKRLYHIPPAAKIIYKEGKGFLAEALTAWASSHGF